MLMSQVKLQTEICLVWIVPEVNFLAIPRSQWGGKLRQPGDFICDN